MLNSLYYKRSRMVVAVLVCVFVSSAWAGSYTFTDLGTLGGAYSVGSALNEFGQVTGYSRTNTTQVHAFHYNGSAMNSLGTLPGNNSSHGNGINENGQIVGSGNGDAFLWDAVNGMVDLGNLGRNGSAAYDVNNNGLVTGHSHNGSATRAFVWDSVNGMMDLGSFGGSTASSYGQNINDNGQVVGYSHTGITDHAFIWDDDNGMVDLGALGADTSQSASYGIDISENGQVAGYSYNGAFYHAFIWDDVNGMLDLGTLGGNTSYAHGINDHGQVVGESGSRAFIWDDAKGMIDLNDWIDPSLGWNLVMAQDINNAGQITGFGFDANGEQRAFLLTPDAPAPVPVPAPVALGMLGMGIVGLVNRKRNVNKNT